MFEVSVCVGVFLEARFVQSGKLAGHLSKLRTEVEVLVTCWPQHVLPHRRLRTRKLHL